MSMDRVLLIGSEGSMGRRYQAIMRTLDVKFEKADKDHTLLDVKQLLKGCDSVVLATPTDTHYKLLLELVPTRKPILCEKPVVKDLKQLVDILSLVRHYRSQFRMMYQYSLFDHPSNAGPSYYNYYHHGNDGLSWDCMQVISLARGELKIKEDSPIWTCMINGQKINKNLMDMAYVEYFKKWMTEPHQNPNEILDIHNKVKLFERGESLWQNTLM